MLRARHPRTLLTAIAASVLVLAPLPAAADDTPGYTWGAQFQQGLPASYHGVPYQMIDLEVIVKGTPQPTVSFQVLFDETWYAVGYNGTTTLIDPEVTGQPDIYRVTHQFQFGAPGVYEARAVATNPYIPSPYTPPTSYSTITIAAPFTVETHPISQSVDEGEGLNLSSTVSLVDGTPVPTFEWQRLLVGGSWEAVASGSSTETTLAVPSFSYPEDDQSRYRVIWIGADGFYAASNQAIITVIPPDSAPEVTQHPEEVEIKTGENASFYAQASGYPVPTVQWQRSADGVSGWSNVADADARTLNLVAPDDDGWYRAVFSNTVEGVAMSATTDAARLTITSDPTVEWLTAPASVQSGDQAQFEIAVGGRPAPSIHYQMESEGGWVDIDDATGTSFESQPLLWADGPKLFRVGATNLHGTVWSSTHTVDVTMDVAGLSWIDDALGVLQVGEPVFDGVLADSADDIAYSISAGAMPPGLDFDPNTGAITGEPTHAGTGTATVTARTVHGAIETVLDVSVIDAARLTLHGNFTNGDVVAGAPFTVSAENLEPESTWTVIVHSTPTLLGEGTTSIDGTLLPQNLNLPADLNAGQHRLEFTAVAANGTVKTAELFFLVGTHGRFGEASLAGTGTAETAHLSAVAAALLGLGLIAVGAPAVRRATRERVRR